MINSSPSESPVFRAKHYGILRGTLTAYESPKSTKKPTPLRRTKAVVMSPEREADNDLARRILKQQYRTLKHKRGRPTRCMFYVVQVDPSVPHRFKLGITTDLVRRLDQYLIVCPDLVLYGLFEIPSHLERTLIKRLSDGIAVHRRPELIEVQPEFFGIFLERLEQLKFKRVNVSSALAGCKHTIATHNN